MCLNQIENLFYDFVQEPEQIEKQSTRMKAYNDCDCTTVFTLAEWNRMKWKTENVCRIDVGFYISINRYAKNEPNRTEPNAFEQLNISARYLWPLYLLGYTPGADEIQNQIV